MISLAHLLIVDDTVPALARSELLAAQTSSVAERRTHLEAAARALYEGADLDCRDALELVGLADHAAQ
jgi:hypothetical protein